MANPQRQQPHQIIKQEVSYSGPLPPPAELVKYNDAHPDAANRIITMAENQATHRRLLEQKVVESNIKNSRMGIFCGFVLGLTAIIGGIVLLGMGKDMAGYSLVIGSTTGLVGVFVIGKYLQTKERVDKQKLMMPQQKQP